MVAARTDALSSPTPAPFKIAWVHIFPVMLLAKAYSENNNVTMDQFSPNKEATTHEILWKT